MGIVLPYYQPWRVVEEIGMLDHLTSGRFEVGTSSGIPQEMALIGLDVVEASERNAEAQASWMPASWTRASELPRFLFVS